MAVNKVSYYGEELINISKDGVTAENLEEGVTAHNAAGEPIVGLLPKVSIDSELSETSTNPVQNKAVAAAIKNIELTPGPVGPQGPAGNIGYVYFYMVDGKLYVDQEDASLVKFAINSEGKLEVTYGYDN